LQRLRNGIPFKLAKAALAKGAVAHA